MERKWERGSFWKIHLKIYSEIQKSLENLEILQVGKLSCG